MVPAIPRSETTALVPVTPGTDPEWLLEPIPLVDHEPGSAQTQRRLLWIERAEVDRHATPRFAGGAQ